MDKPVLPRACALALALGVAPSLVSLAAEHQHAHVHGVVVLGVAIDANTVTLQLEAPLDNLVGFEHAPRTEAQKKAVGAMFERLKAPQRLFGFAPAAQCELQSSSAESEALRAGAAEGTAGGEEHADLDGSFVFACKQAAAVDSIDLSGLLAAFPRIARIDAAIAAPTGQFKRVLKRPDRTLRWRR